LVSHWSHWTPVKETLLEDIARKVQPVKQSPTHVLDQEQN